MTKGKMSLHQAGMNDVLACLDMLGHVPQAFTLIGLQPVELEDYGGSLTNRYAGACRAPSRLALAGTARLGRRAGARAAAALEPLTGSLALDRYESGRPSSEQACRSATNDSLRSAPAPWTSRRPGRPRPRNTPHE